MKTLFENPEYEWRETLFVFFDGEKHPPLSKTEMAALVADAKFSFLEMAKTKTAPDGRLKTLLFLSPETGSAVEVHCRQGKTVLDQSRAFYQSVRAILDSSERQAWKKILPLASCYELVYFEKPASETRLMEEFPEDHDDMDFYDPGTLLFLMEALTRHTRGVAVDPQSGMILEGGG